MTIETLDSKRVLLGNGITTEFDFLFQISDVSDIRVFIADETGISQEIFENFEVNKVARKIKYPIVGQPLATGKKITIYRDVRPLQDASFTTQGPWNPKVVESKLDKLTMMIQQDREAIQRCIIYDIGASPIASETQAFLEVIQKNKADAIIAKDQSVVAQLASESARLGSELAKTQSENSAAISAQKAIESAEQAILAKSEKDLAESFKNSASSSAQLASEKAIAASTSESNSLSNSQLSSQKAADARLSAQNAETKALEAQTSADIAINAANSIAWRDIVFITESILITALDKGKLFSIDCSLGNVTITLPEISKLDLSTAFAVGFKKTDASENVVIINRGGSDTIDGVSAKIIQDQNTGSTLVPDKDPNPDAWISCDFGPVSVGHNILNTGYFYFNSKTSEGSWRIGINAGALVFEKKIAGTWEELGRMGD